VCLAFARSREETEPTSARGRDQKSLSVLECAAPPLLAKGKLRVPTGG